MYDPANSQRNNPQIAGFHKLEALAVLMQIHHETLIAFSWRADFRILSGRAYLYGREIGYSDRQIATKTKRSSAWLRQVGELVEGYQYIGLGDLELSECKPGELKVGDFEHGAFLAASTGKLSLGRVNACIESDSRVLETLAPHGPFASTVLEWRRLTVTGEPPPLKMIVFCMGADLGALIDKHHYAEIACHMAAAFPENQITTHQAVEVVAESCGRVLTVELAIDIANKAIAMVRRNQQMPKIGENSPSAAG